MRVTTFAMNSQYMTDLNDIMGKYQNSEMQLSTGRKLNQPSDNPVGIEADMEYQNQLTQVSEWQSNASTALSKMQNLDSTMSTLQTTLSSIRTNLLQAVNGTNTASDVGDSLAAVKQLIQSVAQVADTSDGQQYIFSGVNGSAKPIDASTGTLTWTGGASTTSQTLETQKGVSIETGVDGNKLFNSPSGSSLIDTLNSIVTNLTSAANATSSGALSTALQAVRNDMSSLDTNIDGVSTVRADLGSRMSRVTSAKTQLDQLSTNLQTQKGNVEDANIAQVMTQLSTQQTVYQAALLAGQHMILPTLADVLK